MSSRRHLALALPLSLICSLAMAGPILADEPAPPPDQPPDVSVVTVLVARLTGDQVVPGPGAEETGSGGAEIMVDTDAGTLCWSIWWDGIDEPTSAAVFLGGEGEPGSPVAVLADPFADGCLEAAEPETLNALTADPSAYFVELATLAYPGGAIRGQLSGESPTAYVATWAVLAGANVLPAGGDPEAEGWVEIDIDVASGSVCTWWAATGLDDATAAELHVGAAGATGAAALTLPLPAANKPTEPPPPDGGGEPDSDPTTDPGVDPCQTGVDPALLQSIVDSPSGYYVDVHTPAYPGGAVRGQLSHEPPPPPPCEAPMVCDGGIGAGDYEFFGFARALYFTLADEWQAVNAGSGFSLADSSGLVSFLWFSGFVAADACGTDLADIGLEPGEVGDWLTSHPALADVTTADAAIGDLPAIRIDARVVIPATCGSDDLLLLPAYGSGVVEPGSGESGGGASTPDLRTQSVLAEDGLTVTNGDELRLILVDLDFGTVVLALSAPAGDAFAALADHAQSVLDSITWGPVPVPGEMDGGAPRDDTGGAEGAPDTAMADGRTTSPLGLVLLAVALLGATITARRTHRSAR